MSVISRDLVGNGLSDRAKGALRLISCRESSRQISMDFVGKCRAKDANGRLGKPDMARLGIALAFVVRLAD